MSLSSGNPKFRVAICGAGIGGLFLAITIGKFADRNIQVDLYEAHDAITTAGAGIVVSQRTTEIIEALGLCEEISRVSTKPPSSNYGPKFRKSDVPEGGFEWFQLTQNTPSSMHRQHLVDILKQHLPVSCMVHLNKRLTKYDKLPAGSLTLHFADESTETTDVLIGADGIRSSVRKTLFETINRDVVEPSMIRHYSDASWTGAFAYRAILSAEKLSEMDPNSVALKDLTIFCGKGKHIVSFPVSQGTMINVVAHLSDRQKASTSFDDHWVSDVPREEVEEAYQDFEPAAKNLLRLFERPSRWALHVVNELPLFTSDRVALIGDACHAMTPYMAAGAGMAIEDAFVLGRLLAHPLTSLDNLPAALKAYQDVCLSVTQLVARESYRSGCLLQFSMHGHYDGTDRGNEREGLEVLKELITRQHDNDGKGGVIAEWLEAEKKLRESAGLCNDCC